MAGESKTKKWQLIEKWEVMARNALANNRNLRNITLAARGLEELFSSCAVVSVFGSGGK
jgi:hypothetical protein